MGGSVAPQQSKVLLLRSLASPPSLVSFARGSRMRMCFVNLSSERLMTHCGLVVHECLFVLQ